MRRWTPLTITSSSFTLTAPGGTPIPGTVSYQGTTATFAPAQALQGSTLYTASLSTGVESSQGIALGSPFSWTFTTGGVPDTTAPQVTLTTPINGDTGVGLNSALSATFTETMDLTTINPTTFLLQGPGLTPVAGVVTYVGTTATFKPNAPLAASTLFTGTITTGAKDLAGNPLAANFVWTFTTGAAPDTLAPTVTSTFPANAATAVPLNTKISATFSEPMDPLTLTTATFIVAGPGPTPITGTVTYVGNTATFSPAVILPASTTFTGAISTGAKDLAGNPLAANFMWTFTTGAAPDTVAPTVTTTLPTNAQTGVGLNSSLSATFSESMDVATINTNTFLLQGPGVTPVAGVVTYLGTTATFKPSVALAASTIYTGTITTGAKDLAGNPLAANFVWTFTTGAAPDTLAPTVSSTFPANAATAVPLNTKISATFSEAMDPLTLTTATFTVAGPGPTPITGTVTYVGTTATFSPAVSLPASTLLTGTITTGAKDLAGNPLAANFVWTFTTGAAPDTLAPTVTSILPANGATNVLINSKVQATFSEAMDPLTITNLTFTLLGPAAAPVPGTVTYVGTTATFTPTANLPANTLFTATVKTGAKDLAGNALASNFVWTFTSANAPDTAPPTVVSTVPADTAVGVSVNSQLTATFSEAMDPLTITTNSYKLTGPGLTAVAGTVTYVGTVATFTPTSQLAANTNFTATITTGVKDLAGNAMVLPFVWTFTTGATPDTTPPTVISTNPANGAVGRALSTHPTATFSEAMDPLTLTTATFQLTGPGLTPVIGTVNNSGLTATFTPLANLATNTLYTATITTGAKDLAGNALAAPFSWTFTTGAIQPAGPVALGSSVTVGGFGGGAGMTNQGLFTVINGDIGTTGASTTLTGFHDLLGNIYTETPLNVGLVNGTIATAPPAPGNAASFAIATQALADAQAAFIATSPAAMPGGTDPGAGELGGLTLAPGIYQAAGGTFQITGVDLTLDGQGDTNATWVFQTAASLTVGAPGAPRSIILINGAQAKNVYWHVGSSATINGAGGGTMVGTIIASAGITFSTAGVVTITTLEGRAIGLNASTTLVNTHINVPAP